MNDTLSKLATARAFVRALLPWFTPALLALRPVVTTEVKTATVSDRAVLYVNPSYASQLSDVELAAVLCHGALHVMRDHHGRASALGITGAQLAELWNIAADCEINDDLALTRLPTGADWYYPKSIGAPDGHTAEEYFAAMLAAPPEQRPKSGGKPGAGECGSGAGNPSPGEPGAEQQGKGAPSEQQGKGAPAGASETGERGATSAELAAARASFAAAVSEAAKARGSVPASLARWADALNAPPRVRWQDKLRRLVGNAVSARSGSGDRSFARPSRRQGGVGFGVGRPVLARSVETAPRVAVAIDTSGSMSAADIARAVTELRAILRSTSTPVQLVACDARVAGATEIKATDDLAAKVSPMLRGGGGTSFIPALDYLAAMPATKRPQVVVYVTDGDGDSPLRAPHGIRIVWCVVGKGRNTAHLSRSGEVVEVDA